VLDWMIEENRVDERQIAACGTSRGGFAALHWAANDPRVRCVAAFAPVTDLLVLDEFRGLEGHALARSLALASVADRLADRRLWVCIGNDDRRVGTDRAIEFTRRVTRAALAQGKPTLNELHVVEGTPSPLGHRVHATAHQEAAEWIATNLLRGP
jgi:dienelactone hydrolase